MSAVAGTSLSFGVAPGLVQLPREGVPRYLIDPADFYCRIPDGYPCGECGRRDEIVQAEGKKGLPSITRMMDGKVDKSEKKNQAPSM